MHFWDSFHAITYFLATKTYLLRFVQVLKQRPITEVILLLSLNEVGSLLPQVTNGLEDVHQAIVPDLIQQDW